MDYDIDNIMNMLQNIGDEYCYRKLCEFTEEEKSTYSKLLNKLKKVNSSNASTNEKGKALEDLAAFVLNSTHIFDIYKNIRTSSNELDQLVKVSDNKRHLFGLGIIDKRLKNFIGECKNYKGKVSVTYVGKVCSLLISTNNKICILFSYNGVTGKNWGEASGLIKKFYLSKEKKEERFCIIDFNIKDFEEIKKGNNFLQIVEDKILALQNDSDYIKLMTSHELTEQILKCQKI